MIIPYISAMQDCLSNHGDCNENHAAKNKRKRTKCKWTSPEVVWNIKAARNWKQRWCRTMNWQRSEVKGWKLAASASRVKTDRPAAASLHDATFASAARRWWQADTTGRPTAQGSSPSAASTGGRHAARVTDHTHFDRRYTHTEQRVQVGSTLQGWRIIRTMLDASHTQSSE